MDMTQLLACAWAAKLATSILEGDVLIQTARPNKAMSAFNAKPISWDKLMEYVTSLTLIASSQPSEPVLSANKAIFSKAEHANLCP